MKKLLIDIGVTFLIGCFFAFFIGSGGYKSLSMPIKIPSIVFPIVWTMLYTLMGISLYWVRKDKKAVVLYFCQLFVNSFWTLFFFGFKWYFFSFIWIGLLIILVSYMILYFYGINKKAALINVPYLLWLLFVAFLNFVVFILN